MSGNKSFHQAKTNIEDEFYTQIADIEKELKHYHIHFKDKTIFCNCDDPEWSNFWKYFELNFEHLGLKKLIATHFESEKPSYKLEKTKNINADGVVNGTTVVKTQLRQNGDFRSPECIKLLQEADIVVTNPPFSLFREYVALLMDYKKKFIIIGNQNNITYKDFFPYLKENEIWQGYGCGDMKFRVPDYYEPRKTRFWIDESGKKWRSMGNICWFTNLDIQKRHENLVLFKKYDAQEYPRYDDYEAINVGKVQNIPCDYYGIMGVPITFLDKYNPDQFEIVGLDRYVADNPHYGHRFKINGKETYARILIRRRKTNEN